MNDQLDEEAFGVLRPLVKDRNITDIDYNGYRLWVTDLKKGRYPLEIELSEKFISEFSEHIADCVNKPFNRKNGVLEAQTDDLRITITHESIALTGRSICIRKSLRENRNNESSLLESGFCSREVMELLKCAVKAGTNIVFCGEPGVGKTESVKFFCGFIPKQERIITIEDTPELHLHEVYPERDVLEFLINENFSYTELIKHTLRKNPCRVILSEARSTEVKYLLEQWSTGVHGFTTLHLDDLRNLPDRVLNMMEKTEDSERLRNNIYAYVDMGVLIRCMEQQDGNGHRKIVRYIDQIAIYDHGEKNKVYMPMKDQIADWEQLPRSFAEKINWSGAERPVYKNG